ncbi:MAG: cellulase family glycosylhydrolase [Clostridiales bacterium]|nr:cellulase family glycosylhydrolase [Clostridiales bacterium]
MKKLFAFLLSLSLVLGLGASAAVSSGSDFKNQTPSELHVEGRYIVNAEGERVRLMGANIPDLQWATGGDNDLNRRLGILLDQWNANCVRLCVHSKFWFGQEWYQNGNYSDYRRKVDDIIQQVTSRGKYVILNLHEFYAITDQNKRFWEDAVQIYKNNPGVIFGLLNEPHDISWDQWKNGGTLQTSDAYGEKTIKIWGHQQILDMIRSFGARNIVIAGGLDWAYYLNGIEDGYDGLEHGYRLEEPKGMEGNGIIYDTHIYPMKPEYNPVEKALDCVVDDVPILVGEYGHWGERLFDWYDNYICEYPHVWMNEIHDYIERNELNYTCWSFHIGANPAMFIDYETFYPTKYSGQYMKYRLLHNPETRPEERYRSYEDPSPLSTWERTVDFDDTAADFKVYGDEVRCESGNYGKDESGGLLVAFDRSAHDEEGDFWDSAASAKLDWDLSGASWLAFDVKGDGDMRKIGIGIELKDGRQFTTYMPLDLHTNWKNYYLPLDVFKGNTGLLDTDMIESVMFTSLEEGRGSFSVDNITIGGLPYEEKEVFTVSDKTQKDKMTWNAWEDDENSVGDSFTYVSQNVPSHSGGSAVKFYYNCPQNSYGGQARATIPASWDINDATYFTFWAKGDGSKQKFMLRFEEEKGTNKNEQRSNFKKRELERFTIAFDVNSTEWKQYKFRISDLGMSDILHMQRLRFISLFNLTLESSGSVVISDFAFTNEGEELKADYTSHKEPKESPQISTVQTKYPDNVILQIPKEFEIEAGKEEHISIHLMNKTDRHVEGEMSISGLPTDDVKNAKYDCYGGYVSYPHYPWRSYSLTNFALNIPKDKKGVYYVTVKDESGNGIEPMTYKLTVK